MRNRQPAQPRALPTYRVPRSRVDDLFARADPLPYVQVGAGEITAVAADGETCTVQLEAGVEVAGVVVLGLEPGVGDWVEVHQRGDLLVVPETGQGTAIVHHHTDGTVARPAADWVLWLGTATPANAKPYDGWEEANI